MSTLSNRYDFAVLFDVTNGNPNGDPDAGNMPRLDPETGHGLVSDVCLKRKVRNYIELSKNGNPGFNIYVQEGSILNEKHREAYKALRPDDKKVAKDKNLQPQDDEEAKNLREFMCKNFFDIRTFGAVMGTGINCGQVRGPVQVSFAQSIEPIVPQEITITRMAATSEKDKTDGQKGDDENGRTDNRTMGRKHIVPYGLYRAHGFISAKLSERTGFSENDLNALLESIENMFEHDRSAARGEMVVRKLIIFKHEDALGNAPAHTLFERIKIGRNIDGEFRAIGDKALDNQPPARSFGDYKIEIDATRLPKGVTIIERL
ncbi:MAG: type I-C CRISPR-associated protein Cas7/Csd2 [Alphaproteobacteria bacterium]|nr:type I-C CRISPR-associated protein Cas7/Csd2 [Alphaproteobacteria bacterium]